MRIPGPFNSGIYPIICTRSGKKIWRRLKNSPAARQCQATAGGFRTKNSTTSWRTWFRYEVTRCEVTGEDPDRYDAGRVCGPGTSDIRTDPSSGARTRELADVFGQL